MANKDNLIPLSQRSEQRKKEIAAMGGRARAKSIQRKKFLSEIYGEMLADTYDIEIDGKKKKLPPDKFFKHVVTEVLKRADGATVAQLKEMIAQTEKDAAPTSAEVDTIVFDRKGDSD
jgi:hypothetical protein